MTTRGGSISGESLSIPYPGGGQKAQDRSGGGQAQRGGGASSQEQPPQRSSPPREPRNRQRIDIRAFTPNMYIDGIYSVINPQVGTTRGGKPFLKCIIRDATGECHARQWTIDERAVGSLGSTGFVWVAGHTQEYNGQMQVIVDQIRAVEVSIDDMQSLLPSTRYDVGEMFAEVQTIMGSLEHPASKALAKAYLDDEALMERFRQAPAAVNLHHAWIGGLLEHTLQLLKLADRMLPLYPELNRDLVLLGLFLHDIAKTAELTWEKGFNYTAPGNLIGHVVLGAIWLEEKTQQIAETGGTVMPDRARMVLSHIILSHHNEPEYGAAKRPCTPEAIFVSMLDNLDAKTAMALHHTRGGDDDCDDDSSEGGSSSRSEEPHFTDKVWALDVRLFKADPFGE